MRAAQGIRSITAWRYRSNSLREDVARRVSMGAASTVWLGGLLAVICVLTTSTMARVAPGQEPGASTHVEIEAADAGQFKSLQTEQVAFPASTDPAGSSLTAPAETDQKRAASETASSSDSPGHDSTTDDEPRELSVEPGMQPLLPEDRPKWVAAPPDVSSSVHRIFVGSDLVTDASQADAALNDALEQALHQYVAEHLVQNLDELDNVEFTADFIRKNFLVEDVSYLAELTTSSGPVYQKWVVLEVTPEQRQYLQSICVAAEQRQRLAPLGLGMLAMLGSVLLVHFLARIRSRGQRPPQGVLSSSTLEAATRARKTWGLSAVLIGSVLLLPIAIGGTIGALLIGATHLQRTSAPPAPISGNTDATTVSVSSPPQDSSQRSEQKFSGNAGGQRIIVRSWSPEDE